MSEANPLGIQASIELIKRLHETIDDFVQRETELTRSTSLSTYTLGKQQDESLELASVRLETDLEALDEGLESAKTLAEENFQHRQVWIDRAWKNSKQSFLQNLAETEGHQKYSIQKTMLDTEKKHQAAVSQSELDYEQFHQALITDRKIFKSLATLATKSFRGYSSYLKKLSSTLKAAPSDDSLSHKTAPESREQLHEQLKLADTNLLAFRKHLLPRFFSILPLSLLCILIIILHLPLIPLLGHFGLDQSIWPVGFGWIPGS